MLPAPSCPNSLGCGHAASKVRYLAKLLGTVVAWKQHWGCMSGTLNTDGSGDEWELSCPHRTVTEGEV